MIVPTALRSAPADLERALRRAACQATDRSGVAVDVYVAPMPCPPRAAAVLLRQVAREALALAARYDRARRVAVVVTREADRLDLVVEDDGTGGDARDGAGVPRGRLDALRGRLTAAGGALFVEATPGAGCRVHARLPLR